MSEPAVAKITDDNGDIAKDDFVKFCMDSKLLDFGNVMAMSGLLKIHPLIVI